MNHQEYTERRDEITKRYVNNPVFEPIAAQAIDALVLQVIGELERPEFYEKKVYVCHTCKSELHIPHAPSVSRDALRAEQRKTVQGDKS